MKSVLWRLRTERGVTQLDVGFDTRIYPSTISAMELRRLPIYPKNRKKLAEYYGVAPEDLIDERGFVREIGDE